MTEKSDVLKMRISYSMPTMASKRSYPSGTKKRKKNAKNAKHGNKRKKIWTEAMKLQTGKVMDETQGLPRYLPRYPKVPHMKSEDARLRTFSNWPVNSPVQPSKLAEAGMFCLERKDSVQCFCCGGMLAQWDQGDDPWNEHEKHYPNCFFICGHDVGNVPLAAPTCGKWLCFSFKDNCIMLN